MWQILWQNYAMIISADLLLRGPGVLFVEERISHIREKFNGVDALAYSIKIPPKM